MHKAESKKEVSARLPRVIAVSSGKGGVGKSSITVNLGISLAKHGAKVCVLDADTGLANTNILLGLTPQLSLEHVLYGAKSIEDVMLDGPHGMKIVPGVNGISECVDLHPRQQLRLTRELARIENDFDFLLIDTAAGISNTTLDFVSASQHALIVITPEPTSLTDAFSLIKLLKRRSSRLHYHVVVNMCSGANQAKEVYHRFCSAIEKYIGIESHYLGFILRDESMRAAVVLQNPVSMFPDDDPSCRSFLRLADTVDSATSALSSHSSFSAYWHRQFRRQRQGTNGESKDNVPSLSQSSASPPTLEQREEDYLSEIRSRVLLLIEQGRVDIESLKKTLQEGVDAFIKRHNTSPVDVLGLVEFLTQSPERNDLLLRDIHERVRYWGSAATPPSVNELMIDDRQALLEMDELSAESIGPLEQALDSDAMQDKNWLTPRNGSNQLLEGEVTSIDNTSSDVPKDIVNDSTVTAIGNDLVVDNIAASAAKKNEQATSADVSDMPEIYAETGTKIEPQAVAEVANTVLVDTAQVDASAVSTASNEAPRAHHYDSERFGSQGGLLEILKRRTTTTCKPLAELLSGL